MSGATTLLLDRVRVPGGGDLRLLRDGTDFEMVIDGERLMSSWSSRSEEALATLACAALGRPAGPVLIGGLGMGFTLAAALAALPATAQVTVAELVAEVAEWASGPLAHVHGASLADARVRLEIGDVHDTIAAAAERFDLILLDVDNGPEGLVAPENERLYCDWGLRAARHALRHGGVLAIWSAAAVDGFAERLAATGFAVRDVVIEDAPGEPPHVIWLATRIERPAPEGLPLCSAAVYGRADQEHP